MLLKLFPIFISVPTVALAEYAVPWQKTFQDPASPIMEGIINLHHDIMFIILSAVKVICPKFLSSSGPSGLGQFK